MGLVMKKFRYPFFESKMSFFPFICRFITMKTVVIAIGVVWIKIRAPD